MSDNGHNKSRKQRRGRRLNAKPLTDKAWYSLFSYWARTERLRDVTMQLLISLRHKYGKDFMDKPPMDIMIHGMYMFLEYWHSTLQVVVEAYEKNNLSDEKVEALLEMPMRDKLKKFRDSSFHFREDFHDPDALSLYTTQGALEWIDSLQLAMHNFLEREARKLDQRLGLKLKTFEDHMKEAQNVPNKTLETLYSVSNIRRNDICLCGSGQRYKHCHGRAGGQPRK